MMRVSPIATKFLVHVVYKGQHSNVFLTSVAHNPLAQYVFTSIPTDMKAYEGIPFLKHISSHAYGQST